MTNSAAAQVEAVRKRFGYRDVLRAVSVEFARGECAVLRGPNGAGKSTLLRILATLWRPTSGRVHVFGTNVARRPVAARAQLGAVFHDSALRPELTLEENLRFGAGLHGLGWRRVSGRAAELLERFGLARRKDDRVRTFSQGMLKRGNIIRSQLHSPGLWLLDEPFAGLDAAGCAVLEEFVGEYCREGGAAVLVTHDAALGARLASRTHSIEGGRLTSEGGA